MVAGGRVQPVRASLPFELLLNLNGWYFGLFWIAEALMFIYKGETLPYPSGALPSEIVLLFFLAGLEAVRLFFGHKGNLTERVPAVVVFIILSIPALVAFVYYLIWQTYVLRAEVVLNSIQLGFIGFELIFALISCITFARASSY